MRLKNQFLGIAVHDLRNPIASLIVNAAFLREEVATAITEEQLGFLSAILSTSEFMLQFIDDFLDISSIEAGNLKLDCRPSCI